MYIHNMDSDIMNIKNIKEFELKLSNFTGTENWYKNMFGLIYTDGIKYLSSELDAYWLIDLVSSYAKQLNNYSFLVWKIEVKDESAIITAREDTNTPNVVKQKIPYTTFPSGEFEFYTVDKCMMLKSEY